MCRKDADRSAASGGPNHAKHSGLLVFLFFNYCLLVFQLLWLHKDTEEFPAVKWIMSRENDQAMLDMLLLWQMHFEKGKMEVIRQS